MPKPKVTPGMVARRAYELYEHGAEGDMSRTGYKPSASSSTGKPGSSGNSR